MEKVTTDCGFEMSSVEVEVGLEMRSARVPESVRIGVYGSDLELSHFGIVGRFPIEPA